MNKRVGGEELNEKKISEEKWTRISFLIHRCHKWSRKLKNEQNYMHNANKRTSTQLETILPWISQSIFHKVKWPTSDSYLRWKQAKTIHISVGFCECVSLSFSTELVCTQQSVRIWISWMALKRTNERASKQANRTNEWTASATIFNSIISTKAHIYMHDWFFPSLAFLRVEKNERMMRMHIRAAARQLV